MKLAVFACVALLLPAASGCSDTAAHRVRAGDVVREFKTHGVVLHDTHLFGKQSAITAGYFAVTPKIAKVTLFVFVCRDDKFARWLAHRTRSPLIATATVRRRENVVAFLASDQDTRSRRGTLEALASL